MKTLFLRIIAAAVLVTASLSGLGAEEPRLIAGRDLSYYQSQLHDENRVVRLRAVRSLGAFEEESGPALIEALKHDDAGVRYVAAVHLGRIGGESLESAVDLLVKLRGDSSSLAVQQAAAFSLCRAGRVGDHLPFLIERLSYPERAMACSAAELIGMLGPTAVAAVDVLEQVKRDNPPSGKGDYHLGGAAGHALEKNQIGSALSFESEEFAMRFKQLCWLNACLFLVGCLFAQRVAADDRPNILWISCEDISPNLGCYGDPHAVTPNLDRLASQGVRFSRAFTPAGVCAVVRSSVITGMYPIAIGSQHMRSKIIPPPEVRCFPELLRRAGYFCTNRDKTDYQFDSPASAWDRQGPSHRDWRERADQTQPFFSVINLTMTHESQIRHPQSVHDEVIRKIGDAKHDVDETVDTLPPYLPDTPASRKDWAWYQDNISLMDIEAGRILKQLEEDGLVDSTIVVFWSDHGMGMPRGKRWIHDSGTHVPMIVRWPGKIDSKTVRDDLVSVIDLAPTMLSVADVEVPSYMQGRVLVGDKVGTEPPYLFFHRDRMDEVFETQRGARDRRWRYIRNYEPEKPYSQSLDYMNLMPTMIDWRNANDAGTLNDIQKAWFAQSKPIEELYDTAKDPWEVTNLASRPEYAERLQRMREITEAWQVQTGDQGMVPEAVLMEEMVPGGVYPKAEDVVFETHNDRVELVCKTDGASIVFRTKKAKDEPWGQWTLYKKSLPIGSATKVEAKSNRLGWLPSDSTVWSSDK